MPKKLIKLDPKKVMREFNKRASQRKGIAKVLSDRFAIELNEEFDSICHDFIKKNFPNKLEKVIDIGIGMGRLARYFSKKSDKLVGIDFSYDMLNVADQYLNKKKNIILVHNDAVDTDFLPNYFDLGIISLTLKHNDNKRAIKIIDKTKKWCKKILLIEHVSGGANGSDITVMRPESWYVNKFKPMKPTAIKKFKRKEDDIIFYIFG